MNIQLLNEESYCSLVTDIINKTKTEGENKYNYGETLDLIKIRVREASIAYSKEKARKQRKKATILQNEILKVEEKMNDTKINDENLKVNTQN